MNHHDPLRSLDQIEVPDRWADIVDRSRYEGDAINPGREEASRSRWLAGVAVLVALVSIAAVVAIALRDDAGEEVVAGPDATLPADGPSAVWDRTFEVTSLVIDGEPRSVGTSYGEPPLLLRFGADAITWTDHCIERIGLKIKGNRLVGGPVEEQPAALCVDGAHYDIADFLVEDHPTIELEDGHLVLLAGSNRLEAVDIDPAATAPSEQSPLWGQRWKVVAAVDGDGAAVTTEAPGKIIVLDAGFTGRITLETCTSPTGAFRVAGPVLVGEGVLQTKMARCAGPLWVGSLVESILRQRPSIIVDDERLVLRSAAGEIEAVPVAPDDPSQLFGHTWDVTDIIDNGESLVFSHHDRTPDHPILEARLDPMVVVVPGCAGAGGPAELNVDRLVPTEPWGIPDLLCSPESLMRQDEWFQDFLADGPIVQVHGIGATLRTDDAEVRMIRVGS
jgi:hypothetical protein